MNNGHISQKFVHIQSHHISKKCILQCPSYRFSDLPMLVLTMCECAHGGNPLQRLTQAWFK